VTDIGGDRSNNQAVYVTHFVFTIMLYYGMDPLKKLVTNGIQ